MRARQLRTREHPDERGVIMILTGLLLVSLITMTAFAVDIGRESATKRQLHAVADIASQDGSFGLGPDVSGSPGAFQRVVNDAMASAQVNGLPLTGANQLTVEIGTWDITRTPPFQSLSPACVVTLPQGSVGACSTETAANAVKVTAATTVKWDFASGSQPLSAVAVAHPDGLTGVQIGTFTARAGLAPFAVSLLNSMLGLSTAGSLSAVSYQGIANSTVTLQSIATILGFGSPQQLLSSKVTYPNLIQATATALNNSGQTGAGASMAGIPAALQGTALGGAQVSMGQVADSGGSLGNGSAVAAFTGVDAYEMLTGGLDAALFNGTNAVAVNNANLNITNVASAQLNVHVIQAPVAGAGRQCGINEPPVPIPRPPLPLPCAEATSAQAESQSVLSITPDSATQAALTTASATLAALIPSITVTMGLTLPLYIASGSGHAWVSQISCGSTSDGQAPVDAWAHTGALQMAIGQDQGLSSSTGQTDLTGGSGANTTTQVAGQTITSATLIQFQVTQAGTTTPVSLKDLGSVSLLGSGPAHVDNPAPAPAQPSFTGPFNNVRGPDPFGAGNVVPGPLTSSGNKLTDAGTSLANQLPNASTSLSQALDSSTLSATTQAALDSALGPVVVAALNELTGIVTNVGTTVASPLASVIQLGLGGADVTNTPYTGLTTPPNGTYCLRPQVVQ